MAIAWFLAGALTGAALTLAAVMRLGRGRRQPLSAPAPPPRPASRPLEPSPPAAPATPAPGPPAAPLRLDEVAGDDRAQELLERTRRLDEDTQRRLSRQPRGD